MTLDLSLGQKVKIVSSHTHLPGINAAAAVS